MHEEENRIRLNMDYRMNRISDSRLYPVYPVHPCELLLLFFLCAV